MSDVVRERRDEVRKVREFLYVDHQRIRSYYAQINRGIIEAIISRSGGNVAGEVGLRLFGFGPSVSGERDRQREESRSLQDLNYVIFEELFENEGLIKEITDEADRLEAWQEGRIYSTIDEGDIVKYTGNIQILDPEFVKNRFNQFGNMAVSLVGSQIGPQEADPGSRPVRQGGSTRRDRRPRTAEEVREALIAEAVQALMGGASLDQLKALTQFIDAFTNNEITARILPFGFANPQYHFAGTLLSRSEYIQPEREALFSRYGMNLNDWTTVMQIARIPLSTTPQEPDFSQPVVSGEVFNRGTMENMVTRLMDYMEGLGMAEGARYPAISVTVLAIYREFA